MLRPILSCAISLAVAVAPMLTVKAPPGSEPALDSPPVLTIRKTTREVQLAFHVSLNGRAIHNLQRGQGLVYQDGTQVTGITGFYEGQDLPLQLVLMIDTSASMSKEFAPEQAAAIAFLRRVIRPSIDQSMAVAFSTHASLDPAMDASSPAVLRQIALLRPSGLTALFDSIYEVSSRISETSRQPGRSRNILVLLSDGDDTYSLHTLEQAIAAAQNSDLTIYAITDHSQQKVNRGDANLEKMAAATGGGSIFSPEIQIHGDHLCGIGIQNPLPIHTDIWSGGRELRIPLCSCGNYRSEDAGPFASGILPGLFVVPKSLHYEPRTPPSFIPGSTENSIGKKSHARNLG